MRMTLVDCDRSTTSHDNTKQTDVELMEHVAVVRERWSLSERLARRVVSVERRERINARALTDVKSR